MDYYWPVIFSIVQLSYLLEKYSTNDHRPVLFDEDLAQLLLSLKRWTIAIDRKVSSMIRKRLEIYGHTSIQKEIISLQKAIQIRGEVQLNKRKSDFTIPIE